MFNQIVLLDKLLNGMGYTYAGIGGAVASGAATIAARHSFYNYTGTGGAITGGTSPCHPIVKYTHTASGGAISQGAAIIYMNSLPQPTIFVFSGEGGGAIAHGAAYILINGQPVFDVTLVPVQELIEAVMTAFGGTSLLDLLTSFGVGGFTVTTLEPELSSPQLAAIVAELEELLTLPSLAAPTITPATGTDVNSSYDMPTAPSLTLPVFGGQEPVLADIDTPLPPTITLPDVPTFTPLTIPDPPTLTIPQFTSTLAVPSVDVPTFAGTFTETPFTSAALATVSGKLAIDLAGGTGIDAAVESGIWAREANRGATVAGLIGGFVSEFLATLPSDVLAAIQADSAVHVANFEQTAGRQNVATAAEIEQKNREAARKAVLALEDRLMTYASQMADRALKRAMMVADVAFYGYQASVLKYKAEILGYRSLAEAYSALIEAELAKVDMFKAQVQAAAATNTLNKAQIASYEAQVKGVNSAIAIYEAQVQGVTIYAEIQANKVEVYRLQVEAYKAQVQAVIAAVKMREAAIKGETAKVDVYRTQVDEFKARSQEFAARIEIVVSELKTAMGDYVTQTAELSAQIGGRRADVAAQQAESAATTAVHAATQEVNSAMVEQGARIDMARNEAVAVEIAALQHQMEIYADQLRQQIQAIDTQGRIDVQKVKSVMAAATEAMTIWYQKHTISHTGSVRDTYEKVDFSMRFALAQIEAKYGMDTNTPSQVAGY